MLLQIEHGEILGGFAHNQVLALADKIVDAVKSGAIKKFVVMAGCDGRMKSRNYYTEFAENCLETPWFLTARCAKYKYNKLNLGDINGIPRVLDAVSVMIVIPRTDSYEVTRGLRARWHQQVTYRL